SAAAEPEMEPEEGKISVWVCREEKLVSGLTKRTTCADVVKVLLEDQNLRQGSSAAMLSGSPQSYCVVEKWRGFERILPNKTKILRLWSAWGDEQENVRFVLVKNEASGGPGGGLKGTAKTCWTAAAAAANLSQEKQRRIVRKAFRKLDKMNKKKEQTVSKDKSSVERMETLVHLVISQDHTIRQQIQRIKELDREIERCERQDARCTAEALAQFEEYARRCEEVIRLQEELTEREALVESITGEIQEELNRRWMKRRRQEEGAEAAEETRPAASAAPDAEPDVESLSEGEMALEEERIRTQLDTSLYIGLRLKTDLDAIRGDLDLSLALWETKESELLDLLAKVETMEIEQGSSKDTEGGKVELGAVGAETESASSEKGGGWVEQARGLSKSCNTNDEDSDTGLSSMHSQDSDNPPVYLQPTLTVGWFTRSQQPALVRAV
uniref:Ras association domain family member 10 n=1 Tax=Echeneis naucrates TaxID=173247 RepID=A0A665TBU1_ECHNA